MNTNVKTLSALETYQQAYAREKKARLQAEQLLEDKTRELYSANQTLTEQYRFLSRHAAELELFLSLARFSLEKINFESIMQFFIDAICKLGNWPVAHVFVLNNDNELISSGIWYFDDAKKYSELYEVTTAMSFPPGVGFPGRVVAEGKLIYIEDVTNCSYYRRPQVCKKLNLRGTLGVPIRCYGKVIAVVEVFTPDFYHADRHLHELLGSFARQLEILLERLSAEDEARENNLKLQQALAEVQQLAHYDIITGLANRLQFELTLKRELERSKHYKHKFALLYIDLDHFKLINDQYGHNVGDLLLREVATRLKSSIRKEDFAARLGGDEFAVIIKQVEKFEDAAIVAKSILENLKKSYQIDQHAIAITASIGISGYPEMGGELIALYKNADIAMYNAKKNGRDNYQYFTTMLQQQSERVLSLETSLHLALKKKEFFLMYQPIFDLQTKKIKGMEVLLRWQHPEYGVILPDEFVAFAEDKNLIVSIGEWVLGEACRQYMEWHSANPRINYLLMINVSTRQLKDSTFVPFVKKILAETGISPYLLEFEVTETALMDELEESEKILSELRKLGINIAIDDFGTGHSSLSRLRQLTVSTLKIDKSFIKNLNEDDDNLIVKSIIMLAKGLNLRLVAEGVETVSQERFLQKNNCSEVQGYYYSHPLKADEIIDILNKDAS